MLTPDERAELERLTSDRNTAQPLALRARIVLACAAGQTDGDVALLVEVSRTTVGKWRRRFIETRLDGLSDRGRPGAGRTAATDEVERVVVKTGG